MPNAKFSKFSIVRSHDIENINLPLTQKLEAFLYFNVKVMLIQPYKRYFNFFADCLRCEVLGADPLLRCELVDTHAQILAECAIGSNYWTGSTHNRDWTDEQVGPGQFMLGKLVMKLRVCFMHSE